MAVNYNDKFNVEIQEMLIRYMVTDVDAFLISRSIINPEYFEERLRKPVSFLLEYADEHKRMPPTDLIKAATQVSVEKLTPEDAGLLNSWYMDTVEDFSRYKALELAILDSVTLLEKGHGGEVERRVKEAQAISLTKDLGTSYFADPLARLQRMRDNTAYVSTGWKSLDKKLYGGFTRGALNIWAGGSGSGKSLWLQNIALNWVFAGFTVIYFTLELSEDLTSSRLDAMVTARSTTDVFRDITGAAAAVRTKAKTANADGVFPGDLIVKKLPEGGTNTNDLRAFIKEYEIKTGKKPDAICIDYLDLMHPNDRSIDASNAFVRDKHVSEELRGLAGEMMLLCATASQLNRGAVEAQGQFDHSHIAGGLSKINTADNVFAIYNGGNMMERGEYQLHFLKTRSSNAVGSNLKMRYDPVSMRITDYEDDVEVTRTLSAEQMREELKAKVITPAIPSSVKTSRAPTPGEVEPTEPVETEADKKKIAITGLMSRVQNANKAKDR